MSGDSINFAAANSDRPVAVNNREESSLSHEETKRLAQQAKVKAAKSAAEAQVSSTKSQAKKNTGTSSVNEGSIKKLQGQTDTALGSAQAATGITLVTIGLKKKVFTAVEEASEGVAPEAQKSKSDGLKELIEDSKLEKAWAMVTEGTTKASQGATTLAYGIAKIDEGTSKLAEAAELGIISKREASTANKEMIRSQVLESKAQMQEQAMSSAKEANAALPEGQRLSDEELQEMGKNIDQIYNKAFQAGAETLKNGGITSLETSEGDRHFIVDPERDGALTEVKIQTDEQGEAILDEHGRLQISEKLEPGSAENLSSEEKMQLIANISVANDMQVMINGDPEQGIPPLARIEIDHESGTIRKGQFDLNDPEQMQEFAMIVESAGKEPPPLKFTEDENGELFFQEWDWKNNSAVGEKVSLNDIAGGEDGDKDLAAESLSKLGLNEGGSRADALSEVVDFAEASDNNGLPDFAEFQGFIFSGRPDASSSRDQGLYATSPGLAAKEDEAAVKGNALSEA